MLVLYFPLLLLLLLLLLPPCAAAMGQLAHIQHHQYTSKGLHNVQNIKMQCQAGVLFATLRCNACSGRCMLTAQPLLLRCACSPGGDA
jgi:cytochrome c-type biogenesis protein CcmH/NrfF